MRLILSIFFVLTVSNALFGQEIQGYINDENTGHALKSILIKATSESDTSKHKITVTDATGFYQFKDIITEVRNIPGFGDDKLIITRNGNQMEINVTSNTNITSGKLFTLDGRTISVVQFEKIGVNEFKAVFNIQGIAGQTVVFDDGFHPGAKIIPSQLSMYGNNKLNSFETNLKGANASVNNIKFELDDEADTDNYQPLVIVKEVDLENTNYFDFQLKPWQKFYSTLNFNLEDTQGNKLNNESVKIKHLESSLEYSEITDSNGDAAIENIPIPNMEGNKGIPDSLDFAVEISGEDIETELDTLWKVTAGEMFLNYHNLTLKNTQPEDKQYTFIIKSQDEKGNAESDVAWTISTTDGNLSWTGNTGSNALDTLSFLNPNTSLNLNIHSSKEEHKDYDITKNISSGQSTITTVNELLKYLYQMQISGKDSETQSQLDSISGQIVVNGELLASGNSLEEQLLNLQTTQPGHTLNIMSILNRNGYLADTITTTISEGQVNQIIHQLTKEQVIPTDKQYTFIVESQDEKGNLLANTDWMLLTSDSTLIGQGNTGSNSLDTLLFENINPSMDVILKSNKEGYSDYRSETNIQAEAEEKRVTVNELIQQQEAIAYLWRAIRDPLNQLGTTADITITNDELNYQDTRLGVGDLTPWKDTVPVNPTGTTQYTITIHPHVANGKIPLYDLVKTINLSPNQTAQGYDDLKSLEQQVVIKGDLDGSDGGEAGVVNVVFTNSSGQQFTTTTNSSGEYRLGPFPVGTTGDIDFIIPTNNPKSSTYFNHKDIPVGGTPIVKLGTVPLTSGPITAFEDSVLTYNPLMIQKQWTYPVTGENVTIHPEYLKDLEGTSYNASWALWGEQRVYNTPNSDNPDWPTQMGAFIEKHTGVPFKVIVVDTERAKAPPPQMTSLDPTYLASIKDQMGINAESLEGTSGLTNVYSAGSTDNIYFHTTADVRLRAPSIGEEPTDFMYVVGMRELIGRNGEMSETNQYVSFMNGATPNDLTVTNMTQDFANVAIIYTNMSSRAKRQTHTGLGTVSGELAQPVLGETTLWRKVEQIAPVSQWLEVVDIKISIPELDFIKDTFLTNEQNWYNIKIPVNSTGTTQVNVDYHPHHDWEHQIPYYDKSISLDVSLNEVVTGRDTLNALEQQVRLKGDAIGSDGQKVGIIDVVFNASDGNTYTTTTTSDGKYDLGIFPVGTTGDIDFIIPSGNPKSSTYFNHKDIPVGGTAIVKLGTVPLTSGPLTAFEDSVLTYNPLMIQKQWTYPVTGEKVTIHPEYLKDLEGNSYNASWAIWGEQRVYNTPNSDNPDWPTQMGAFIEKHTGVPYNVIVVDTEIGTAPKITSLDPTYLQSIRNQMGINVESLTGTSGLTNIYSAGSIDGMIFHTESDITVRCPEQGTEANDLTYAIGMREFVGRNGQLGITDQYKSFLNSSLALDIKVTDLTQDFANVAIIYTNMSSRAKKKTHTGLGTVSE